MKYIHIPIMFVISVLSPFNGFCYYLRHIEKEDVTSEEVRQMILSLKSESINKFFKL